MVSMEFSGPSRFVATRGLWQRLGGNEESSKYARLCVRWLGIVEVVEDGVPDLAACPVANIMEHPFQGLDTDFHLWQEGSSLHDFVGSSCLRQRHN